MIPGITIESADCRLRIPVFLITDIYFLIFPSGISADFQVSSEFLAAVPRLPSEEYPEMSCVWPTMFAIRELSTLRAHDLLHCHGHQSLLNDVDSTLPSLKITPPSLDREDNQARSAVLSVIWA